ncbi:peptidase M15 [Nocardia brasiliensis]|uniref:Peptidase M15 n=1 Tax=Nocardia brasiliensis TaxID=37326 RepID=A0A6G9XUQ8_NOCBR|nr:M15 family metallopeptidase [Nocardia brasiliensis]QIS04626.1 peptidase M15 [Nocardia brasiliensis]
MVLRSGVRGRVLIGLPVAVLPLVVAGLVAPRAAAVPGVAIDQRAALGSAAGTEGLQPRLALAYTLAEAEAHAQGVPLSITSGYRSHEEQQWLWNDGLAQYGSPDEARRWVLPPEESTHVSGRAVDVGPQEGAHWLEVNGNTWGLCRMFDNEWWHFELATTPGGVCPPMKPDASVH